MAAVREIDTGDTITEGLQGCDTCDEALIVARQIARERGTAVLLEDDDGAWVVPADGSLLFHYREAER